MHFEDGQYRRQAEARNRIQKARAPGIKPQRKPFEKGWEIGRERNVTLGRSGGYRAESSPDKLGPNSKIEQLGGSPVRQDLGLAFLSLYTVAFLVLNEPQCSSVLKLRENDRDTNGNDRADAANHRSSGAPINACHSLPPIVTPFNHGAFP